MEITRNYSHKVHGEIGTVTFTVPDGEYKLDGKVLPESSVSHLVMFALQTLQDAYAGADNADEAKASFAKKLDKLVEGTIGTRGDGTGASQRTIIARSLVRNSVKLKYGAKSPEWAKFTGLADADQIAKLDEWIVSVASKEFEKSIDQEIARRAAKVKIDGEFSI